MTIGTNTAETRSASRWTGALPAWACSTSRAIWASCVSAPIRVARTTSRPPSLTVAPTHAVAGTDLDGHALARQHGFVDRRGAVLDDAVGGHLLARADHEAVPDGQLGDRDAPLLAVRAQHGDVLRPERHQGTQRGAGAAGGPGLEVAPGQEEHRDRRGHLEVQVVARSARGARERERHRHPELAGAAEEQRPERPAERGQHAERDEGVHRRRAVAQVGPGGTVEGPGPPRDDGDREGQGQPLPAPHLEGRDHGHEQDRDREHGRHDEPAPQRGQVDLLVVVRVAAGVTVPARLVPAPCPPAGAGGDAP